MKAISPLPFGPSVYVLTSSAASNSFTSSASKKIKGAKVSSLKNGIPDDLSSKDICIMLTPSTRNDYQTALNLARSNDAQAVVIVNAFAKVRLKHPFCDTVHLRNQTSNVLKNCL